MRKLRVNLLLLFLVVTTFKVVHGATLRKHEKIIFKTTKSWGQNAGRVASFIPLDAYIVDNRCIKVHFFGKGDSPSTFQIKDNLGHLIYQDIICLPEEDIYRIELDGFSSGKYTLIYYDEHVEIIGDFEKE